MNTTEHFYLLLKPLFPDNANIKPIDEHTDELVFRVDWRVPTAARLAKRSRPIHLKISRDVLDDFEDDPSYNTTMDTFISAYIRARLTSFVDDGVAAPPIEWHVVPDNTFAAASLQ
jgi:hypothetical protein